MSNMTQDQWISVAIIGLCALALGAMVGYVIGRDRADARVYRKGREDGWAARDRRARSEHGSIEKRFVLVPVAVTLAALFFGGCAQDITAPEDGPSDEALTELAMSMHWAGLDNAEQAELCEGFEVLGPRIAYQSFRDGWDERSLAPTQQRFTEFYGAVC